MFLELPISEVIVIKPTYFNRHFSTKYRRPLQKLIFFLFSEGFFQTLRKYKSSIIERKIENEQEICIASFSVGSKRYIGFTRNLGKKLIFHNRLIFEVFGDRGPRDVTLNEKAKKFLESYLPVEPCPIPEELIAVLREDNQFLHEVSDNKFFQKFLFIENNKEPMNSKPNVIRRDNPRDKVYFIGFGSYVRQYILHHFGNKHKVAVDFKAALIKKYYPCDFPVYNNINYILDQIVHDIEPLVIISTYHSTHANIAFMVLEANPTARVFIEKPIAVGFEDVLNLIKLRQDGAWVDIGFNRRYAELTKKIKLRTATIPRPLVITTNVKELQIPATHWYFWKNQGTRITGNVCHWIDLSYYLVESLPTEINLLNTGDTVVCGILFQDGSIANITASEYGNGKKGVEEYIEIRGGNSTIRNLDYKKVRILNDTTTRINRLIRNKGHEDMYIDLKKRWLSDMPPRYPIEDMLWVSFLTAKFSEMLSSQERHYKIKTPKLTA